MTAFLDKKYINLLSYRFNQFEWKSVNLANCKCFDCEHETKHHKKRGYFIEREDRFYYYCHHCNLTLSIKNLLKRLDIRLFEAYMKEHTDLFGVRYQNTKERSHTQEVGDADSKLRFEGHAENEEALKKLKKLSQLSPDHPAKKYIVERRIPNVYHTIIRWCPSFMAWTNTLIPGKFNEGALVHDEGRIIIPFFDEKNRFYAYTGRSLSNNSSRYILIVLDHNVPLLYGLFRVNYRRQLFVVEGPIDSMFLDNCLAMVGSNISALTKVSKPDMMTVVYDNEPDKPEMKKKINEAIDQGFNVCIWPSFVKYKDINEMVMNDWDPKYIEDLIKNNTFKGMDAKLRVKIWSQCG